MKNLAPIKCEFCRAPFQPGKKTTRFCSVSCAAKTRAPRRGPDNPNWRGGKTEHPLYDTYLDMIGRCLRPTHKRYADYGGRGITVCDRWQSGFWAFVADMGERPNGLSLDRINNDGPYSPDNCRWATAVEQRHNRRPEKRRTHCAADHEYTPENTRVTSRGARACRTCDREWARQARQRRAAA